MNREDFYGDTDKLLFDILQELKKLNEPKEKTITSGYLVVDNIENKEVPKGIPCSYCNGTHENRQQMAGCASKQARLKKKGCK